MIIFINYSFIYGKFNRTHVNFLDTVYNHMIKPVPIFSIPVIHVVRKMAKLLGLRFMLLFF